MRRPADVNCPARVSRVTIAVSATVVNGMMRWTNALRLGRDCQSTNGKVLRRDLHCGYESAVGMSGGTSSSSGSRELGEQRPLLTRSFRIDCPLGTRQTKRERGASSRLAVNGDLSA